MMKKGSILISTVLTLGLLLSACNAYPGSRGAGAGQAVNPVIPDTGSNVDRGPVPGNLSSKATGTGVGIADHAPSGLMLASTSGNQIGSSGYGLNTRGDYTSGVAQGIDENWIGQEIYDLGSQVVGKLVSMVRDGPHMYGILSYKNTFVAVPSSWIMLKRSRIYFTGNPSSLDQAPSFPSLENVPQPGKGFDAVDKFWTSQGAW